MQSRAMAVPRGFQLSSKYLKPLINNGFFYFIGGFTGAFRPALPACRSDAIDHLINRRGRFEQMAEH
jgi:hypothetical protein